MSLATELAEVFASIVCVFIANMFNLKHAMSCSILVIAIGCSCLLNAEGMYATFVIMVTNLGVCVTFNLAYLMNAWLFPTEIISTTYGLCNIFGRMISILSPIVAASENS